MGRQNLIFRLSIAIKAHVRCVYFCTMWYVHCPVHLKLEVQRILGGGNMIHLDESIISMLQKI